MAMKPYDTRYLVVCYEQSTDTQSIACLAEYTELRAAKADVREKIAAGSSPKKIRVFKAIECMYSVITDVEIFNPAPSLPKTEP